MLFYKFNWFNSNGNRLTCFREKGELIKKILKINIYLERFTLIAFWREHRANIFQKQYTGNVICEWPSKPHGVVFWWYLAVDFVGKEYFLFALFRPSNTKMVKLDASFLRYMEKDDFRVLTAVEMGMRNHELVPRSLVYSISGIHNGSIGKILLNLTQNKLLVYERGKRYDGYRLTYRGYDFLALNVLRTRGMFEINLFMSC